MLGWICPKCGTVWSPQVISCTNCLPPVLAVATAPKLQCTCGSSSALTPCPMHAWTMSKSGADK